MNDPQSVCRKIMQANVHIGRCCKQNRAHIGFPSKSEQTSKPALGASDGRERIFICLVLPFITL